jgi:hypothetical protein
MSVIDQLAFPGALEDLFCFQSKERYGDGPGWSLFNAKTEFRRQGADPAKWRLTLSNRSYDKCPTYPSRFLVPRDFPDTDLEQVYGFRSKGRVPAVVWVHPTNGASVSRCSQPFVGLQRSRCSEDERLLALLRGAGALYVLDARPRVNAMANLARGKGFENMSYYPNCAFEFLNIGNIHVMRSSLQKVTFALLFVYLFLSAVFALVCGLVCQFFQTFVPPAPPDLCQVQALCSDPDDTNWFKRLDDTEWFLHIRQILLGSNRCVDLVS